MLQSQSVQQMYALPNGKEYKPMKKMICLIIAAVLVLALAACSSSSQEETAQSTSPSTEDTAPETTVPETTVPETTAPEETFEEIVLAENDDITFKITGVENDPIWGYTLKVYLENKTEKELMFSVDNVSVNGYMCDPFWASTVDAGKKANEDISFSESDFETNGIETVTDITFTLRIYDNNDWTAEDVFNDTFTVNP